MRTGQTWVIVAEAGRARIFALQGLQSPLKELEDLVNPEARAPEHDLASDRPGRTTDSVGGQRHAKQPQTSPGERVVQNFARTVADHIERARTHGEFEHLIVAANYDLVFSGYEALDGDGSSSYQCQFSAMPTQQQFRPRRLTPKPFVQGPQTAMVVGPAGDEIHTDQYGRVKVQFHWDRLGKRDENSSCWIRVSQPWAGKGWGSVSIPRIGQEVIVDFLEGDPDQPIITGRVYNGDLMPPYALPAAGMVSGLKSCTTPGGGGCVCG